MTTALLAQLGQGGGGLGGGNLPQPPGIHPAWLAVPIVLTLIAFALCFWLMWRVRTLVRAVRELKSDSDKLVQVPGPFAFLRFKLRTLIILLTVVAIPLGMFMIEFRRAQRQAKVLEKLELSETVGVSPSARYRLGMLGDSALAAMICDWVHPHFGCRLDGLMLFYYEQRGSFGGEPIYSEIADWNSIGLLAKLPDLESLAVDSAVFLEEDVNRLGELKKLRRLQLMHCKLPAGTLGLLLNSSNLEHLEIIKCDLKDADLAGLQNNIRLKHLDLSYNSIQGEELDPLLNLKALESLLLVGNLFESAELSVLSKMEKVRHLNLSHNQINYEQLKDLAKCKSLERMSLSISRLIKADLSAEQADEELTKVNKRLRINWNSSEEDPVQWEFYNDRPSLLNYGGFNGAYSGSLFNGGGFQGGGQF